MKSSIPRPTAVASLILLSSLFHTHPICADGCPAPSFVSVRAFDFDASLRPQSLAMGDFNGDGKPDLVVADFSSDSVAVLLGKGDGEFLSAVKYGSGPYPFFVAVGDFNGDGKPDLVVANRGQTDITTFAFTNGSVSVLLGKGDGTFQAAVHYDAGADPQSIAAGDFNGDGRLDLAVANNGSTNVSVLLGNSDGTFQNAVNYGAGIGPGSVAVGDFNGDGKPDLAVANIGSMRDNHTDGNVSVLLGNGDGTFRSAVNYGAGSVPRSVTVSDFNGDGKLDLAVANLYSDNFSVLLGKGDGTFQPAVNYATGTYPFSVDPVSTAVGDFNGDSKPDLAVANITGNVSVLLGRGDGTFETAVNYLARAGSRSLTVGDFNGDGKADLAVAGYTGVSVLMGDGSSTFQAALNHGGEPHFAAVGDFNGDGKADLVVADNDPDNVFVLLGNGDGTFQSAGYYWAGKYPGAIAVEDFNADGKADLAVANSDGVSVLLGKGDGTFRSAVNYAAGTNPQSVTVGHFNGDGRPDLAVANLESGNVSVLLGNGDGTFPTVANYKVGGLPRTVAVGDFNKDGKADLAVANEARVPVMLGNGDGTFQAAVDYGPIDYGSGQGPYSVAVDDFNGDGNADLLVRNVLPADWTDIVTVSLMLGKGDGAFQRPVKLDLGSSPDPGALPGFVVVGDFNGDGKPDLAITSHLFNISTNISVILGKGDGTFQRPVNFDTGGNPFFAAVGDFNGDGKSDLAVLNSSGVSVLLNTCLSAGIHLGVAHTNTGLTLSWPLTFTGFVLESTTSVGSTNWQHALEVPTTNSGRLEFTAPFDQPGRFFRLRKP